jgi:hypothetical protein
MARPLRAPLRCRRGARMAWAWPPQSTTRAPPRTASDRCLGLPRPGRRHRRLWRSHATSTLRSLWCVVVVVGGRNEGRQQSSFPTAATENRKLSLSPSARPGTTGERPHRARARPGKAWRPTWRFRRLRTGTARECSCPPPRAASEGTAGRR